MAAVDELVELVQRIGYTKREIVALRLMAQAGIAKEAAAVVVLSSIREGTDPIWDAQHLISLVGAFRG